MSSPPNKFSPDASPPRKNSTISSLKSSKFNDETLDTVITIPPDGGWGWVIVAASFFCNFMADGTIYTFGIFLDDISASFHVHQTQIAIGNSLMTGFYYIIGPVSCALVNRCGFRLVGFIGGFTAAAAICSCTFAKDHHLFLFLFGVLGGCGFGMAYVPSVLIIGFYFDKWRSLATSIAVTGSAAGIMLFPVIIDGLLGNFKWQLKFQFLSAGTLITCVLALIYKPLRPIRVISEDARKPILIYHEDDEDSIGSFNLEKSPTVTLKNVFSKYHNVAFPTATQVHATSQINLSEPNDGTSKTSVLISNIPGGSMATILRTTTSKLDEQSKLSTVYEVESEEKVIQQKNKCCSCVCCRNCKLGTGRGQSYYNRPMYRDDIFYAVPVPKNTMLSLVPSRLSAQPSTRRQDLDYTMSVTRVATHKDLLEEHQKWKCCPESVKRTLVTMLDLSMLKSPSFLLLCLSGFFSILGIFVPFMYCLSRAHEYGIGKSKAVYLISALGVSNGIGRILSGVISSFPLTPPLLVCWISLGIAGLMTIISNYLYDVYGQYSYVCIFGCTVACLASLKAPIAVEMVGIERLTNAFGIMLLFQSASGFMGIPVAGAIMQASGSYSTCFIFSGCCLVFSAILLIPIKRILIYERKKRIH